MRLTGWIPLSALALGVWLAPGGASFARSLEDELSTLIIDHPQIRAGQKAVESSRQAIKISLSSYYPQISVIGDIGPERIDSPATQNAGLGKDFSRTRNVVGVTITQNVFSGFANDSSVRTARLNKEIAEISLEGTRQNTLFEGINAYIEVLRQQRLIGLSINNERNIRRQYQLEDERVRRGSGITVDVLQAKSRLQIAKERRVTFEGALKDAISRYFQIFNRPPNIEGMIDPAPPVELVPSTVDRSVEIALVENPAIDNSITVVEMARENRRAMTAQYSPVVDVIGKWNYEKHKAGTLGTRRDYSVVLQTSWDLFTGFSTRANISQATYDYRASKDNFTYITRKVVEQTRLAWQALLTSRQRLDLLENAVNIAAEVFMSRKKLREAGKETVINVLDAENEVNNAQINFTAASYDERLSIYQLLLAMGRLNPVHLNLSAN